MLSATPRTSPSFEESKLYDKTAAKSTSKYLECVGSLQWLTTVCRPDLCHSAKCTSQSLGRRSHSQHGQVLSFSDAILGRNQESRHREFSQGREGFPKQYTQAKRTSGKRESNARATTSTGSNLYRRLLRNNLQETPICNWCVHISLWVLCMLENLSPDCLCKVNDRI